MQRLRRIRQLGVASLAFPGAEHTRFAHAIGAAHVMKRLLARLRDVHGDFRSGSRLTSERARERSPRRSSTTSGTARSRTSSRTRIPGAPRTTRSGATRIILDGDSDVHRVLAEDDPAPARARRRARARRHPLAYLARAVSGTLDVDRCDYLLRDAHATGVRYGDYDLDWLLRSLTLRARRRARHAAPPLAIDGAKGHRRRSRRSSSRASSCSSRSTSTRRRARRSG